MDIGEHKESGSDPNGTYLSATRHFPSFLHKRE